MSLSWALLECQPKQAELDGHHRRLFASAILELCMHDFHNCAELAIGLSERLAEEDARAVFEAVLPTMRENERYQEVRTRKSVEGAMLNDAFSRVGVAP